MVKLQSFVRGPLKPYVTRSPKSCFGRASRPPAEQHVCSIAHLDRWMSAEGAFGSSARLHGRAAAVRRRQLRGDILDTAAVTAADVIAFVLVRLSWPGYRVCEGDRLRVAVSAGLAAPDRHGPGLAGDRSPVCGSLAVVQPAEGSGAGSDAQAGGQL